ncbi:MAG: peptide chain release factor 1 [Verrucomicrobiaceae bacterium]|nr:MAG: peptide chain release factor 1 [Verrucomicrobiaceae bacterium]
MDYTPLIEKRRLRLAELDEAVSTPDFYSDSKKAGALTREHAQIKKLLALWDEYQSVIRQTAENEEMVKGDDPDFAAMAAEELPGLRERNEVLATEVQYALLPREATEDRDAIVEIRAGTGGDEAGLFAADLLRMYTRYADAKGWRIEPMDASTSDAGGYREVVFKVTGEEVFRYLKYESGVHRVQRVPATEAQGRIHTSTATVAVLPEADEVDVEIRSDEVRIEVCRASGAGGQGVNTTDSAVQVLHLPTGLIVRCQDGRSQIKNKEKALTILRSRLLERKQQEEAAKYSANRKALIGSGGREEKIRTYNYPQNRITDHRVNLTLYNLSSYMEGDLAEMVGTLQSSEMAARLEEAGLRE